METKRKLCFERGDIILDLKKENPRLILGVINDDLYYEFMELKDHNFHDIFGTSHSFHKGNVLSQPIDIVETHFSLYKIE